MINFEFYNPTKVIFGKDTEAQVGKLCENYGYKNVVIVGYGGKRPQEVELLERVCKSLDASGINHKFIGGVVPNPRVSLIREVVKLINETKADLVLAIGGGSVIDTCKAAALAVKQGCDPWEIYEGKYAPTQALPVACVVTIAAAGSETSNSSVISNDEGGLKRAYNHDCIRPVFTIMNPELTYTLPPYQTACGVADIMMHTIERYFTQTPDTDLTDRLSEGLIVTVMENGLRVMKNPADYEARAQIMWAGSLSHNGLMGTGLVADFASHQIEHELGGMFDVAHGAGLTAIWASWARYVYKAKVNRFAQYAVRVMACEMNFDNPEETALNGIAKTEAYFKAIGMPISMSELGIHPTDEQIYELSHKCTFFDKREIGNFKKLNKQDIINIYNISK